MLVQGSGAAVNGGAQLSMRPPNSLHVVLAVCRRKEEVEERKLTALTQQIQQATAREKRLAEQFARFAAERFVEVERLSNGLHHQASDGQFRAFQEERGQAVAERGRLEALRLKQMAIYLAARSGREVISELEEQRTAAYRSALAVRERKRNEDLFLSLRVGRQGLEQ